MSNYKKEFPGFVLPRQVRQLVQDGILEDVSWHNDAVPSFMTGKDMEGREITIYVNCNDRSKWEDREANQFYVCRLNPETESTPEDLLMTDDFYPVRRLIQLHALTSPEMLGAAFVRVLEEWLGKKTMRAIAKENAVYDAGGEGRFCASHEYCDANMAMDAAFKSFDNDYDHDPSSQKACDLWNAAWDCGKKIITEKYGKK